MWSLRCCSTALRSHRFLYNRFLKIKREWALLCTGKLWFFPRMYIYHNHCILAVILLKQHDHLEHWQLCSPVVEITKYLNFNNHRELHCCFDNQTHKNTKKKKTVTSYRLYSPCGRSKIKLTFQHLLETWPMFIPWTSVL